MVERFLLFPFILETEVSNPNWILKMATLSLMYLINVEVHHQGMLQNFLPVWSLTRSASLTFFAELEHLS